MSEILSKIKQHSSGGPWADSAPPRFERSSSIRPQWLMHLAEQKISMHFDNSSKHAKVISFQLKKLPSIIASASSLLARVATYDVGAMEQCIQQYSNLVWNLVKRRVASHATAEDLVQEIFTEIWKSASRYDASQGSESTFIGMIARRRVIDWTRKQMRTPMLEPLPEQIDDLGAGEDLRKNSGVDGEMVTQAVAKLSDQTKRLFHLHFDQGLTQLEIAAYTEMPLGTVKTVLRRGLLELRSLLSTRNNSSSASD